MLAFMGTLPDLEIYREPLTKLLVVRMMRQLATVYDTVKIPYFVSLIDGLGVKFDDVEKLAVVAVKARLLSVRIDHKSGTLRFQGDGLGAVRMQKQLSTLSSGLDALVAELETSNDAVVVEKGSSALEAEKVSTSAPSAHVNSYEFLFCPRALYDGWKNHVLFSQHRSGGPRSGM
jgi:hypothetical protein